MGKWRGPVSKGQGHKSEEEGTKRWYWKEQVENYTPNTYEDVRVKAMTLFSESKMTKT